MIAKPLNLIIVFILSIINFLILLTPFALIVALLVKYEQQFLLEKLSKINFKLVLSFVIFIISALMIIYLFLDSVFGFSVRTSLKGCKRYENLKKYGFLDEIFKEVCEQFGRKDVGLYVSKSNEINAFAVASMGRKAMVLTNGLINHTLNNSKDKREFLIMLRSIMGHEMSHLVNKDYLPALLIITNQKVTWLVSKLLEWVTKLPLIILGYVRLRNRIITDIVMFIYNIINKIVTLFNEKVIFNLYEFIRRFISRSIEFRCDRQSAQAFGGYNMSLALSLFGDNGYFTLFSTHPNTDTRIKKVENVTRRSSKIRPLISSSISNYLAYMSLILICALSAKTSQADIIIRYYLIDNHDVLYAQIQYLIEWVKYVFELAKRFI